METKYIILLCLFLLAGYILRRDRKRVYKMDKNKSFSIRKLLKKVFCKLTGKISAEGIKNFIKIACAKNC